MRELFDRYFSNHKSSRWKKKRKKEWTVCFRTFCTVQSVYLLIPSCVRHSSLWISFYVVKQQLQLMGIHLIGLLPLTLEYIHSSASLCRSSLFIEMNCPLSFTKTTSLSQIWEGYFISDDFDLIWFDLLIWFVVGFC